MNTKNLEVHVEDNRVWLNTEDELLTLPKHVLETMLTELVKELNEATPKSKVDEKIKAYIQFLEWRVKMWKTTAFVVTGLYFAWSIFRIFFK
jgi:hypothetical protein